MVLHYYKEKKCNIKIIHIKPSNKNVNILYIVVERKLMFLSLISVAREGGRGAIAPPPPHNAFSEFCRYIWKFVGTYMYFNEAV